MDELALSFEASFEVTSHPNNPATPHPRFQQYKCKRSNSCQEERRRQLIELQKKHRYDYVNHFRQLIDNGGDQHCDSLSEDDDMDWTNLKYKPPPKSYKNQLMLSEWLVDVPDDLETNWCLVLCPVGKRNLVVTVNGSTKSFTKSGFCVNAFPSFLPGGSRRSSDAKRANFTLLDCIYNETERTYYVLDVMTWGGHPVLESETEFRFFWLRSKFEEVPEVQTVSRSNPYRFVPLPHFQCTAEEIRSVLHSPLPFAPDLDGLLFYHKLAHYMHGPTPLVGWLKAYMVPEILNIDVPASFLEERPARYTTLSEHVRYAAENRIKKPDENAMEVVKTKRISKSGRKKKKQSNNNNNNVQTNTDDEMDVAVDKQKGKKKSKRTTETVTKSSEPESKMEMS